MGRRRKEETFLRSRNHGGVVAVMSPPAPPTVVGEDEDADTQAEPVAEDTVGEKKKYDPGAPPPFSLADIRNAIPNHCFEKDSWRSFSYVVRDVAVVLGLAAAAAFLNSWFVWPFYWLAQGTMFWALFVAGHDCGHGSFSNNKRLNDFVGHLTHSSILVPFHGWRISHRNHHANHGHVENDESWTPATKKLYDSLNWSQKIGRYSLPLSMFAYPFYLWFRTPGKTGSHFDPSSDLFLASEEGDVRTSATCYFAMAGLLVALSVKFGIATMLKLYVVPYWVFVMWLDAVTYLHHHGHETKPVPWYRGEEWSYFRGGLSTIDRDYGIFNNIHHDIGTHVVHHLFPQIPHYHLVEATEAAKSVMGEYYREPEKSGLLPLHLFKTLWNSFKTDRYVADEGDVVYYQSGSKNNNAPGSAPAVGP
ncbi:hypothetical protein CBR_g88560 [Chara braunii]|uniref:Fatty acid desaturase domain-containing protein n=1 Tax=Chara braunii TaxID=69332 RepID=A0A388KB72_CHABU|nr:hypothetical protein CBR_g88560 [Chara braunii]|eukprot:GBG67271.1 hypothetical protein CBR_g88560 [Chara braunii]